MSLTPVRLRNIKPTAEELQQVGSTKCKLQATWELSACCERARSLAGGDSFAGTGRETLPIGPWRTTL
jgi:hypothetical protein